MMCASWTIIGRTVRRAKGMMAIVRFLIFGRANVLRWDRLTADANTRDRTPSAPLLAAPTRGLLNDH
jgi:hypothetical protein